MANVSEKQMANVSEKQMANASRPSPAHRIHVLTVGSKVFHHWPDGSYRTFVRALIALRPNDSIHR